MISGIDSFPLLAVPFFIMAGNLMNNAGITNRIYNFALALVGWLKGGLGHVNIIGSVIFAGMSGTAIADAAGLGTIEIKAMRDHGYDLGFSVGVTAASATLGPIIPPSLPFVIYGMMANVSVGQLFVAGILPGGVMAILMMLTVAYYAHKYHWGGDVEVRVGAHGQGVPRARRSSSDGRWRSGAGMQAGLPFNVAVGIGLVVLFAADWKWKFDAVMPIMTPVLLIGGMTTGVFTPTEGAIAACVWALVLGLVWYRTLTWSMLVKVSMDTIETTATVLFIVAAASIFGWLLTATRVTDIVAAWVLAFTHSPWMFLLLANVLMLFVGCFLEPTAAILILVPVLLPVVQQLGIDPVHFGLVMVLNLMIGLLHPPMGMVLFVLARVAGLSVEKTTMAILPWLVPLLAVARPDHLRAADLALAAARLLRSVSAWTSIRTVEILQVDLPPKVVRTDAIQSFVKQETPIVRITCSDGAQGIGYTYTIGTGGSSVVALLRDHLCPRLIGRDAMAIEASVEGSLLPHARNGRRRDHEPRARGDRHRAVGLEVPARARSRCGRWQAARNPRSPSTRPKAAGCTIRRNRSSTKRSPRRRRASRARNSRSGSPRSPRTCVVSPRCAMRSAMNSS